MNISSSKQLIGLLWLLLGLAACATPRPSQPQTSAATNPPQPREAIPTAAVATAAYLPTPTLIATITQPAPQEPTPALTSTPVAPETAASPTPSPIDAQLDTLTLPQKISQMIMVGMPGDTLDPDTLQRVADHGAGGIILLEQNATSPQQLQRLTAELQQQASQSSSGIPLFIAWNHEGGRVSRRRSGMTLFPSAIAVGATGDAQNAYRIAQAMAVEMASLGVNMNYAPVLDVNVAPTNPVIGWRAYGADPALVAEMGGQVIAGLQDNGIIAVGKHFPGHGGVTVDSHIGLPTLNATVGAIQQTELVPFQAAIDADIGALMVAHLQAPSLEPSGLPTSLSPAVIDGLLRGQLGFDGVVMTDDMTMGALNGYAPEEAAVLAVLAGNDMLLTISQSHYERFRQALIDAVNNGRIPESRIDNAVRRILTLKSRYDLVSLPSGPLLPGQDAHRTLSAMVGRTAVRTQRDDADWLPLALPNNQLLLITPDKLPIGSQAGDDLSLLGELAQARGISVTERFYTYTQPDTVSAATQQALAFTPQVDAIVIVTWDAVLRQAQFGDTSQESMVQQLLATGKPVIVVTGNLPYDAQRVPWAPAVVAMFGDTPGQLDGALFHLLGQ